VHVLHYIQAQLAQINMMKGANKKLKNVWISKQHLKFILIVPPAREFGGNITAGFGKILKFINAKSSSSSFNLHCIHHRSRTHVVVM